MRQKARTTPYFPFSLQTDDHYPEPERFSPDVDWMPNVVFIAKMVYVWLGQLSKKYGREITRLDQIPDEELDLLARWGFTGLWLIGIWERSPASQKIKQLCGNQEAISSAYSLFDYQIEADLGGWEALGNFRERALARGIRLASDMVPNHTGIYSRWTVDHPDWFVQLDYPPYPSYTFDGPDTLLLAEAFWLMEGYFVRTLGMHRVYNSAFMNMLKMEENAKYRQTIKNVLEFDHEVLKRFVNFMNNPDERTAIEQFGKEKKYLGATVTLVTMPGLPMFGHGQIEGLHEKYGMEYRRALWSEPLDEHLVAEHEARIFPLMRRRRIFSNSAHFVLYDFISGGSVDENVFAYSNRAGSERGLILYNNRFDQTAGWIHRSVTRAETSGSGESRQTRTTLGEALSFNPDETYHYVFHDLSSGLEYIRNGRDLCENGFYVELDAYEYHAFLDFREICDDDDGAWGKLCSMLQGRPVPSVDEELKSIRFERLINSFREIYAGIDDTLGAIFSNKGPVVVRNGLLKELRKRLTAFIETVAPDAAAEAAATVVDELALIGSDGQESRCPHLPLIKHARDPYGQLFLFTLMVLRGMGIPGGVAEERDERAAARFVEFGIRCPLEEIFTEASGDSGITSVLHISILLNYKSFFQTPEVGTCPVAMQRLFNDRMARQFLRVHKSDGVEWFVKERFEMLLDGLAITGHIERMTAPAADMPTAREQGTFFIDVARLNSMAGRAGYLVGAFLGLIAENTGNGGGDYENHPELG